MGKLNSLIKFVVFNVNALVFLGGMGMIAVASLILTADFIKLAKVSLKEAAEELPNDHGEFEGRFRDGYNKAYFEQLCSASVGGESWVWSLSEDLCPGAISRDACSCSDILDGVGLPLQCSVAETYSARDCCPDQEFCERGLEQACPYAACRPGILDTLLNYITPARKYSTFVFVLEGLVLILTCLLICYNPRDSTEDILIKTGTLVKRHGQLEEGVGQGAGGAARAGAGGSEPAHLGETGKASGTLNPERVQPGAALAKRRSSAGLRQGAGGHKPRGSGTPPMSPLAASNAPEEPLRQFMTPRRSGGKVVFTPDSPTDGDEGTFEFHNPRRGKSASVGPPQRPTAAAAAEKAMAAAATAAAAAAAAAAGGPEVSRTARGGTRATTAVGAGALGGMVSAADASQRRKGEEKMSQQEEEEEEKEALSVRQVDFEGGGEDINSSFYDGIGAQTPVAEYGDHRFEKNETPQARKPAATLAAKASSIDPNTFLTDGSSVPDSSISRGFLHAGGTGSYHALPSPLSPPLSDAPGRPSGVGKQTPILTSPMATNISRPQISVANPATNPADGVGDREEGAGTSARLPHLLAQTPIASPPGGSPPSFAEQQTAAPPAAPTGGSGTAKENSGISAESGSAVPAAAGESAGSAAQEEEAFPPTSVTQVLPDKLSISIGADAQQPQAQQPQENIGGDSASPGREQRPSVWKRFLAKTPVGAQTPIGAQFNTPTMSPAPGQEHEKDVGAVGSAAYPGNSRGGSLASVAAAEALRLGPPSEEPSLFPESVEVPSTPQHVVSTAGGRSRKFLVQTPVASPPRPAGMYDSTASTGTSPAASTAQERGVLAAAAGGGGGGDESRGSAVPRSLMAQTPESQGYRGPYESSASADTQPTTSPAKDAPASAATPAGEAPKGKQGLGSVEGGPPSLMAQTPVPQGNPARFESTASADTQPTASPATERAGGGGRGRGRGDDPAGTDAASAKPAASGAPSRFARFLSQAQESMSRAQMALSLESESLSPERSPAHISPLRPDGSAAAQKSGAVAAAAAAVGSPADELANESGKPPQDAAVGGGTAADGDGGVEHAPGEPEPGHE
eukprot:g9699.t1